MPALHVGRTDPVHAIAFDASSGISVRGHRVGVATQHEPPIAPQLGASDQIVTYSVDAEMSLDDAGPTQASRQVHARCG